MTPVRLSVVIPTHNRALWLPHAIDSVLAQQYLSVEVIVVDDYSTDDTALALARYGDRIRTIRRESWSECPARVLNDGVRAARGEYVAFLGSDDMWLPDKLARQMPLLDDDPRCGFVYGNFVFLDDGIETRPAAFAERLPSGRILGALVEDMCVHPSTLVVRRAWLERIGGFDEAFTCSEDYDLLLRLARLGTAASVAEPLAIVRRHPGQVSRRSATVPYHFAILALERVATDRSVPRLVRKTARRSIARHHTTLARLHLAGGGAALARRHIRAALIRHPLLRSAWSTALRSLRPGADTQAISARQNPSPP